ncbi:MAG: hypothetical protein RMJ59_05085 [Candidatus Nitrosocaldus sp.]|nr:hypothetical protein [Candidatus Nitrosocaldus sp.]MCS7142115.1 hypothetical protein [Candidatus Nitrosocaldus sp.]MDW8000008.1 hypothetical protein [Candidatus Nitrosocaldus sp.]MDW8275737.1 hypothetical protein [Candidatus Nitrosocaldus sp.]
MMNCLDGVKGSLDVMMESLKAVEERRERLIKGTRDALMLCSKAIVCVHINELDTAWEKISDASRIIGELRQVAGDDLQMHIVPAETELVEARVLYSIVREQSIPLADELRVSIRAYLLGLLDCIGELKRQVYDRVREGKSSDALRLFEVMESLYSMLLPFSAYDNVVQGVRRKVDVARMLIEDVRAMLTEEMRRSAMLEAMKRIEARYGGGGSEST